VGHGLTFHDVVPLEARDGSGFRGSGPDRYKVDPTRFAACLDAIAAARVRPGLLDTDAAVALTFDDGGISAVETTAPLLEARGILGYFLVVTDRIGTSGFLDADACRRLAAAGHVVGSHGVTHRPLTRLRESEVLDEWRRSREALEDVLGAAVTTASVPRGYYDDRIGRLAAAAGYATLFTSEPWLRPRRSGSLVSVGRFSIIESTSPSEAAALARGSRLLVARRAAGWEARKIAKRALGPGYDRLRARQLAR
jgi:peptidoglycan/xylan/chitin deacetylase (PgdA/CDA1 family)